MKPGRIIPVILLSGVIAGVGHGSAQQTSTAVKPTPTAATMSAAKTSAAAPLSRKEFDARKKQLRKTKQMNKWPTKVAVHPGTFVVDLTVSECIWLGGKVVYWDGCEGTLMKCVAENGREMCISEVK